MYVCMYVYLNERKSNRVLVRLGLDSLIGWLQLGNKYIVPVGSMYVCVLYYMVNGNSCITFRLFSRVCSTSCGPMALAMYPKVFTEARRMAFLWACMYGTIIKKDCLSDGQRKVVRSIV